MDITKVCTKCRVEKSLTDFYKRTQAKSGRASWCKECSDERQMRYRTENREKIREIAKRSNSKPENIRRMQEYDKRRRAKDREQPVVYMFLNSDNEVIYVGRGTMYRVKEHRARNGQRHHWWPQVAKTRVRKCATWADSLVLESLFIRRYQPRYNTVGVIK